ncbi:MAG TPA: phosphatidate cytidylyltransferase, partial [Acidimicrobiales bacterium]|nr:phosphatidate cytidylyltransferase [Acidimicrobiales bacterium]
MDDNRDETRPTQGVRIIGAEEAAAALRSGEAAGRQPAQGEGGQGPGPGGIWDQDQGGPLPGPQGDPLGPASAPELPHWTDPPTGEVPAVLASGQDQDLDAWSGLRTGGVSWRDEHTDWEDSAFEPSMLGGDDTKVGALDDSEGPDIYSLEDMGEALPSSSPEDAGRQEPAGGAGGRPRPEERGRMGGSHRDRQAGGRDAKPKSISTAVVSGVAFGVVAAVLFKLGPATSLLLSAAVVGVSAAELYAVLRRAGYRPATLLGLAATIGLLVATYMKGEVAVPLVVALTVVLSFLWYMWGVVRARPTVNVGVTLAAFMWVGFLGSFAGLLLDPHRFPNRHGVAFLVSAVLVTIAYDVGALVFGAVFGRHPLAPALSPNKTWEGLLGGLAFSLFFGAVVVGQVHPWTIHRGLALGLVVGVVAPLGDLCESMVKRDIGVKDMANTL